MKTMFWAAALTAPAVALAQGQETKGAADTALTLYNQGPAVVWQNREVTLEAGRQTLAWPDAPPGLIPESLWLAGDGVSLDSATAAAPGGDSPTALLSERIGKTVTLLSTDDDDATRQATLVSVAGHLAVVRIDDRLELIDGHSDWRIAWPAAAPDGAHGSGLQLTVSAESGGDQSLALVYQRPGLNWHASYTGRYNPEAGTLTLQSLAVISNGGQAPVQADRVALIAGDVARESASRPQPMYMARMAAAAPAPKAQEAGGYYRYELDGAVELAAGATQILPLMHAQTLDAEREYRIEGGWYSLGDSQRTHATIRLRFENGTDKPLPAGPVRVYGQQPAMLLGEDHIDNTPTGAPVTLTLGQAFDITAERRMTAGDHEDDVHNRSIEITVFNARDEVATVTVAERLPQDADIVSESIEHERKTPNMAIWLVDVPANGKTTLEYSVRWTQ